jgi:hypothetical protein
MYTNPHPDLPPLKPLSVVDPANPEASASDRVSRSMIVGLVALVVALASLGWGFTQWTSARDWRHRSEKVEATFAQLQTRATNAENARTRAEVAAAKTHTQLVNTQGKLASVSNQFAFTKDVREEICAFLPGLSAQDRARICP